MRSNPYIDYFPLVAKLSEKRKRVDVAPSKAIKFAVKKRKLVFLEDPPSKGEENGSRGEDAEPEVEGERTVEVEEGERKRSPRNPMMSSFPIKRQREVRQRERRK